MEQNWHCYEHGTITKLIYYRQSSYAKDQARIYTIFLAWIFVLIGHCLFILGHDGGQDHSIRYFR
jgi:hypothetical protein